VSHPDQWFGDQTFSQHGEDLVVLSLFKQLGIDKPTYLDVGAHHPLNISNTALLNKRGSIGIDVEPNPNLCELLKKERPRDIILNVGVGRQHGRAIYHMIDDFSGRNTFSESAAQQFVKDNPYFQIRKRVEMDVMTLDEIVDQYWRGAYPDFLSIDCEGMDAEILRAMRGGSYFRQPKVICVESPHRSVQDLELWNLLKFQGYDRVIRMGENVIWVQQYLAWYLQ